MNSQNCIHIPTLRISYSIQNTAVECHRALKKKSCWFDVRLWSDFVSRPAWKQSIKASQHHFLETWPSRIHFQLFDIPKVLTTIYGILWSRFPFWQYLIGLKTLRVTLSVESLQGSVFNCKEYKPTNNVIFWLKFHSHFELEWVSMHLSRCLNDKSLHK